MNVSGRRPEDADHSRSMRSRANPVLTQAELAARVQSVESRPFESDATEFLSREDDVSVNITPRTVFALTAADFCRA